MDKYLLILAGLLFVGAMWLTAPAQEDIEACMKVTGWAESRCEFDLNR